MIRFGTVRIDRKNRIISNGARQYHFSGYTSTDKRAYATFDLLQHLLLAGGKTSRELFEMIYGNDPHGGPIGWWETIAVLICQNLKNSGLLEKLNMELRAEKFNGLKRYWVVVRS